MPTAIDEMIRWVSPVRHFMRTATADTEVAGQKIKAEVDDFYAHQRIETRRCTPTNAFVLIQKRQTDCFRVRCSRLPGQHLARMEMSSLFRKLLER